MKVFQKRISLFLAILLTLSTLMVVPFTASAEETATENWYDANATVLEVGSYADLLAFVEACNDGASDVTGSDGYDEAEKAIMNRFAGKTVKLTVDIDMADKTWNQIAFFAGTFDGQGHTIRNLTMTAPFFGATTGNAVIQNLVIVDGSLVKTTASNLAFFVFQPTAGSVTTFNNIYLDATISGAGNVGGFVSRLNLGATVKFNNCVSNAIICSTGNGAAGFVANTKDNGSTYDVRFVSKVNFDGLSEYNKVGFEVSVKVKGQSTYLVEKQILSTGTVLTSINAGGTAIAATELGAKYLYALQIKGFQKDTVYEITLVSFAEMQDGTVIYNYGNELTLNVQNGTTV